MAPLWPSATQAINFCCNSGPLPPHTPLLPNNHVEQVTYRGEGKGLSSLQAER